MHSGRSEKRRNVVPRWRSIVQASELELRSAKATAQPAFTEDALKRAVSAWEAQRTDEHAVDMLDAALIARRTASAFTAAAHIAGRSNHFGSRVVLAASHVLQNKAIPIYSADVAIVDDYQHRSSVAMLRSRLAVHSRDAVSWVELSRLHTRAGSLTSAKKAMEIAINLAPDSRFVLRSATRLFTTLHDPERAIRALRRSSGIDHDPWLQSAEIATSELLGIGSKCANRGLALVKSSRELPTSHSELCMAVATLESHAGVGNRKLLPMIEAGLTRPTENAVAQAVWLLDDLGRHFRDRFPAFDMPLGANEARAIEALEAKKWGEGSNQCLLWMKDQPFQSRGPQMFAMVNTTHLMNYRQAADVAKRALRIHTDDWYLLNSVVVAEALDGKMAEAQKYLARLQAAATSPEALPFVSAAKGLISFQNSDAVAGRMYYKQAFEDARSARRPDLVVNASIFYLESEARLASVDSEELITSLKVIDEMAAKIAKRGHIGVKQAWDSRKNTIERIIADDYARRNVQGGSMALIPAIDE